MPAAHRHHDLATGHPGCGAIRDNVEASPDTFINDKGAHRQGDSWAPHCANGAVLTSGSPTTYVNDRQLGRIGDPVSCGSSCLTGSPDTFVD